MSWDRHRSFAQRPSGAMLAGCPVHASAWASLPDDLYIPLEPWPRLGRPAKHDLSAWTVTDDWPERVPVTQAEMEVFEAWFGDFFDELFGSSR